MRKAARCSEAACVRTNFVAARSDGPPPIGRRRKLDHAHVYQPRTIKATTGLVNSASRKAGTHQSATLAPGKWLPALARTGSLEFRSRFRGRAEADIQSAMSTNSMSTV